MRTSYTAIPLIFCFIGTLIPNAVSGSVNVKVGVYYYVWYNPESKDPKENWSYPTHQDRPWLGYYRSDNETTILQHFEWWVDLKIDFVIISWWGIGVTDDVKFRDNATKKVFEVAKSFPTNIKLCLMVESIAPNNFTEIYNYIWETYVTSYHSIYFQYNGKPLLLFFNHDYLTDNQAFWDTIDDRFTVIVSGHKSYAEWIYNNYQLPFIPKSKIYPVSPRYDNYYCAKPNDAITVINRDLQLPIYENQWREAIKYVKENRIDIITIATWNEFPERTAIEPHYDRDAWNQDPFYLYNLTKQYLYQLKEQSYISDPTMVTVMGVTLLSAFIAIFVSHRYHYKKKGKP